MLDLQERELGSFGDFERTRERRRRPPDSAACGASRLQTGFAVLRCGSAAFGKTRQILRERKTHLSQLESVVKPEDADSYQLGKSFHRSVFTIHIKLVL